MILHETNFTSTESNSNTRTESTRGVFTASNTAELSSEAELSACRSATSSQWCSCLARLGAKAAH